MPLILYKIHTIKNSPLTRIAACEVCNRKFAYLPSQNKGVVCSRRCCEKSRKDGPELIRRFWRRVVIRGPDDCWLWRGYGVYGLMTVNYEPTLVHRFSMQLHVGRRLKKTEWVLHKCDNPKCVNPKHLFIGTPRDNMQDMMKKGRQRNPRLRLNDSKVKRIRSRYKRGHSVNELASDFGVNRSIIKNVVAGKTWQHLT